MNTLAVRKFQKRWGRWFDLVPALDQDAVAVVCSNCARMARAHSVRWLSVLADAAFEVKHVDTCSYGLAVVVDKASRRGLDDRRRRAELVLMREAARAAAQ